MTISQPAAGLPCSSVPQNCIEHSSLADEAVELIPSPRPSVLTLQQQQQQQQQHEIRAAAGANIIQRLASRVRAASQSSPSLSLNRARWWSMLSGRQLGDVNNVASPSEASIIIPDMSDEEMDMIEMAEIVDELNSDDTDDNGTEHGANDDDEAGEDGGDGDSGDGVVLSDSDFDDEDEELAAARVLLATALYNSSIRKLLSLAPRSSSKGCGSKSRTSSRQVKFKPTSLKKPTSTALSTLPTLRHLPSHHPRAKRRPTRPLVQLLHIRHMLLLVGDTYPHLALPSSSRSKHNS
ncbi:hypothetical protein GQ42DRAFT_171695 [Ramicandelaber brevisporus]|nr:hypothetical protein GQ42DRAFT_171695 [Ramicandelaber brevisporus]